MKKGSNPPAGPIVTIVPRQKHAIEDDNQVEEYSDTFISIRQSVVGNSDMDDIDLTPQQPPTLPHHDYSNVGMAEEQEAGNMVAMKKKPPKPPPFHSTQQSNGTPPPTAATVPPRPSVRTRESPKAPRTSGESPKPVARSNGLPTPPARSTGSPKPSRAEAAHPPVRQSYDHPYQLKAKPPVKKKPTAPLTKTKPGSYDDPEEVLQHKEGKAKPKKPSREGLDELPSNDNDGIVYDIPEEGMYNTAEAVYDDTGVNLAEVAASPKFDDGIYMSGGGIQKERSSKHEGAPSAKPQKPPTPGKIYCVPFSQICWKGEQNLIM